MSFNVLDIIKKDKGAKDRVSVSDLLCVGDVEQEFLDTGVATINLASSAKVKGGIPIGKLTMMAAPSMSGKTFIGNSVIRSAQKKGMNVLIIDTERAFSPRTAKGLGIDIDSDKFAVIQDNRIEVIESSVTAIVSQIPREERKNLFILLDSWGTLLTSKTVDNALNGNDAADFTDPKKKNRLALMLLHSWATVMVINHVYDNVGNPFGDPLMIPGGRKLFFASEVVILGQTRAKEKNKETKQVTGIVISCISKKSRFAKEDTPYKFRIKRTGGLDRWFGLLDWAMDAPSEYVFKPKNARFQRKLGEHTEGEFITKYGDEQGAIKFQDYKDACTRIFTEDELYTAEFWKPVFEYTDFQTYLETMFAYNNDFDVTKENEASPLDYDDDDE